MEVQCLRDSLQGLLAMHDDELTNDDDIVYTTLQLVRRAHEVATSLLAEGRYIEAQRCLDACREATAVAATGGRNRSGSNSDMDMETVADTKDESVSGAEANTQGLDHSQEQEEEQPQGQEETEGELRLRGTPLASEIVRFQQSPPRPPPVHAVVEACLVPPAAASVEVPLEVEVQKEAAAVVALPPINAPSTEPPSRSPVMLVDPLDEPLCGTSMKGRMEEERSDFGDRRAATTRSTVVSFGKHEHWLSEDDTYLFNCLHERTQQLQRQITAAELSPPTIHPPRTTHYYMHKLGIVVDPLLAAQNAPIAPPDTVSMHPSVVADRKDHPQHPRLAPPPPERAINIGQRTKINEWKVRTRLPALVTGPVFLAPTSQPSSSSDDDEVKSAVAAIEDVRSEDGASRSNQDLEEEYSGVHSTEDRLGSSSPVDAASVAAAAGMTNAQMPPRPPLTSAALLPARRIFPTHVRPLSVDFAMSPNSLRSSSAASGDALDARGVPHLSTLRDASSGASTSSSPLCNGSLTTSIGNPKRSREVSDACTMRTALAIMHADEVLSRVTGTVDQVCTRGKTMLEEHYAIVARENRRRAALLRGMSHTNGPPAPAKEEPPVPSTVAVKKEVSIVSDDMAEASCSSVLHYFPQPSDGFTLSTGAESAVRDIKASFERKKEHAKTTTDVLHAIAASHDGRLNPEERKSTPVPPRLGTVKESSAGAYETPLSLTQRPLSVSHSDDGDGRLVVGCSTEGCSDAPLSFPSIHPAQASASSPKKGGPRPPRQPLSRSVSRRSSQPRELGSVAALMSSGVVGKKKEHSVVVADLISRLTDSSSYVFDDGVRSVILQHLEKEKAEAEVREGHKRFSYSQDASPPRLLNSPTTTDGLSSLALQNSGSIYTSCVMRSRVTNRILGARRSIGSFNPPVVPSTADPDHRRRGSCISSAFSISIGAEPRTMTVEADLSSRNGSSSVDRGGATDFVGRDCDPLHNAVLIQDDSYVPSLQELHLLRLPWTEVCPAILSNCLVVQLAAIRLQRIWRGFLARKLVDEHLVVLDLGREEEVRHDAAAIILQRFFRKRFAKRLYAVMQGRVAFMNEQRIESEKKRMTSTRSIRSADVEDESFPLFSEDAHGSTPTGNLSDAPITPATARSDSMPCFQVPYYLKGQFGGMQLKRIQRSVAARRIYLFYRQQKENAEVRQEREAYALLRYVTNQCTADEAFVSDLVEDATDEEALSAQPFAAALALHRYSYKDDLPPLPDLLRRYDGNILNLFDERMAERKHNGEYLVPLQHVSLRELERSKKFREDAALSEQKKQDRERQKAEEDQRRRERQCLEAVSIIQRVGRGFRWRMGLRRQFMKEEELHRHHPRRTEVRQRTLRRTNSMHNSQSTVSTYLVSAHELSAAESYLVPAAASMAIHRGISERHPQWFNHNVRDRMEQRTQLALLLQRFMMASQSQGAAFNKYLFAHAARIQRAWRRYRRRQHKKHTSHGTNNSPISPGSPRRRKKRVAVTFADEYHI